MEGILQSGPLKGGGLMLIELKDQFGILTGKRPRIRTGDSLWGQRSEGDTGRSSPGRGKSPSRCGSGAISSQAAQQTPPLLWQRGLSKAGPARRSPCRYGNGSFPEGGALHAGGGLAERRAVRRRGRAGVRHGRGVTGRAAPVPPGPLSGQDLGEGVRRMEPGSSRWQPVVRETHGQREQVLRREKEQQAARLLWPRQDARQDARQERAELLAQHQQRLSALEQQHQLEWLRELQRFYQHLAAWTEPGWGLGDLKAHGAPSLRSSPPLDPNTQSKEQQIHHPGHELQLLQEML
ncbi:uncharacterized protein LOC135996676 [Caloenas nicobarica]|uniref:uncharacterized protein LOC135996676 n=1 Tax=Caloenas nicobarica TaxID=187106 RepID=UPI0032B85C6C